MSQTPRIAAVELLMLGCRNRYSVTQEIDYLTLAQCRSDYEYHARIDGLKENAAQAFARAMRDVATWQAHTDAPTRNYQVNVSAFVFKTEELEEILAAAYNAGIKFRADSVIPT